MKSIKSIVALGLVAMAIGIPAAAQAGAEEDAKAALKLACPAAGIPKEACGPAADIVVRAYKAAKGPLGSFFSEHPRAKIYKGKVRLPLYFNARQKSRVSDNIELFLDGARTAHKVRAEFLNVKPEDLKKIHVTLLSDKRAKRDGVRSKAFGHGETFTLKAPGRHDRANYFARLTYVDTPGQDRRKEILLRNPNIEVRLTHVKALTPLPAGRVSVPLQYMSGEKSRVSRNFAALRRGFDHEVRVRFLNVRNEDIKHITVTILEDKRGRSDKARSSDIRDGQTVRVSGASSRARGYYIARLKRDGRTSKDIRREILTRNPKMTVEITPVRTLSQR